VMRSLLAGCGSDGAALVAPVWRGDPRGRVPAAVLVRAIEAKAAERGLEPVDLLSDSSSRAVFEGALAALAVDARIPRRPRASLPVTVAGQLAVSAGLDPVEVFRADGRDVFGETAPFADARVDVRRSGLDLTFSAPKSVSVLFGLGDPRVATEVREAHRAAVQQTVVYLEDLCARAARGHHTPGEPVRRIATTGWAAVAFEHRSSRSGDPQLHTHVVVPNLVCGTDGRWSAWDTSEAYREASTGGYLYQAVLRGELSRRLRVAWGPVRRGMAEVEAVPGELRRLFSQRRQAIEEHLDAHGQSGPRAAQVAVFATRRAKGEHTDAQLRTAWTQQALDAGFDPQVVLAAAVDVDPARLFATGVDTAPAGVDVAAVAGRVLGERGVTARSSSFDRRALLRAVCEAVPAGVPVSVASLREMATRLIRDPAVIPLITDAPAGARRYSTAELLSTEATALQAAADRAGDGLARVDPGVVDAQVAVAGLSVEQAAAVRQVTTSGAGVEVVVGPAGAGKTAALLAAHAAWRSTGRDVRGAALAAIAARTLAAGTGIPSQSLTRLTRAIRMGDVERGLPPRGGVLVVDEAGMVGTRDLAELIDVTDRAGVKLVLVGDPAQLPEIDAGGLFAALADSLPAARLSGNLRQRDGWERAALELLRDGDVLDAVTAYDDAGRLHLTDDAPAARAAIVGDYLTARTSQPSVVMLTSRRVDARVLNAQTRHALMSAGGLGLDALVVQCGSRRMEWRVGDEAVVTANHYPLGLINGSRGQVSHVSPDGVTIDTELGRLKVPAASLQAGVLEYGYALTCHKAQGITVDVALLYASRTLTREAGYVGMSRGRRENHLYGTLESLLPDVDAELDHPVDDSVTEAERSDLTRAALVQRLETRGSQRLALRLADSGIRARLEMWLTAPGDARAAGRGR
jgi:conjugative relaxase-like TrwC/TraI family protein